MTAPHPRRAMAGTPGIRDDRGMMTFIWIVVACVLAVVWVLSIVDILRRRYPTGTTIGWIALVLVLPFLGSVIYWLARKPTQAEVEAAYLAESDFRRGSGPPR